MVYLSLLSWAMLGIATAQQPGNMNQEDGPTLTLKKCTLADGCTSKDKKLTLDSNWRWVHQPGKYDNCYTGNTWDTSVCTDPDACARSCELEGITAEGYETTYGITNIDGGVRLNFVTEHEYGVNVGARLYMMEDPQNYEMFFLKNREFSMEFDVSHLECGMNGAMYFVEMPKNGGKGLNNNRAGAKFGTGYCDAQCPHDLKFIDGQANLPWKPNPKDLSENMGIGPWGACCNEMDIWEANKMSNAYTPHPCSKPGLYRCEGTECGDNDKGERYQGVCDKDGCDINPFRMGNLTFYGPGPEFAVDTTRPMTVITQFLTDDCTDDGVLSEIRRHYVQDGKLIHSPPSKILWPSETLGEDGGDSIHDTFCTEKKILFGDENDFMRHGGNKVMGESLDRGHVLVVSLWDDVEVSMMWLDSEFPRDKPGDDPGIRRGTCAGGDESAPMYVREKFGTGWTSFRNAAVGEIGSTMLKTKEGPKKPPPQPHCKPGGNGGAECNNMSKERCEQMQKNEGKCEWDPAIPGPTPPPDPVMELPKCRPMPPPGPTPPLSPEDAKNLNRRRRESKDPKPEPKPAEEARRRRRGPKPTPVPKPEPTPEPTPAEEARRRRRGPRPPPAPVPKPEPEPTRETARRRRRGPKPLPKPEPQPEPKPEPTPAARRRRRGPRAKPAGGAARRRRRGPRPADTTPSASARRRRRRMSGQ